MAKTPIEEVVKTVAAVRILQETVDGHERTLAALTARLEDIERRLLAVAEER